MTINETAQESTHSKKASGSLVGLHYLFGARLGWHPICLNPVALVLCPDLSL